MNCSAIVWRRFENKSARCPHPAKHAYQRREGSLHLETVRVCGKHRWHYLTHPDYYTVPLAAE